MSQTRYKMVDSDHARCDRWWVDAVIRDTGPDGLDGGEAEFDSDVFAEYVMRAIEFYEAQGGDAGAEEG